MSPLARSSQESASSAVPAKPSLPTAEISQEATSSKASLSAENIALKQRLATLEIAEKRLTARLENAETQAANDRQRAIEAEKRTTAAEKLAVAAKFETNAATARAKKRYTEMLHANNETRHLRIALDKEKDGRAEFLVGATSVFQGLKDENSQLRTAKDRLLIEKASDEGSKELTRQLDVLQAGFVAGEKDKKMLNKIINQLNNTVNQLRSEKEVSDKMLEDFKSVIADLRQEVDAEKAKTKVALDAPTKDQIETDIATARNEASKDATAAAQRTIEAMKAKMREHIETTIKTDRTQAQAQAQQYLKTKLDEWRLMEQTYKENIVALELRLLTATKQIELHGQRLKTGSDALQHAHQRPTKHGQQISPQETFNPNKRRKLDSYGAAGITTPDFQHTRSASLLSDTNTMSPRSAANANGDTMMDVAQMQGQAQMTPHSNQRRHSSQQSNGSAGRMSHTQRFSQQQNGTSSQHQSLNIMSPQQQQRRRNFRQQMVSNNASRQSPTSGSHDPHPTYDFPQLQQRMGNGQQTTNQSGNLSLYELQDFNVHQLQQMRSQIQSQAQAQISVPMQQQMQRTQSYGPVPAMPPPQPRAGQILSNPSMPFDAQPPSTNQEASSWYAPTVRDTGIMTAFEGNSPSMGETYARDSWLSNEDKYAMRGSTLTTFTPTLPSNGMPQMQAVDQQTQQRGFQYHNVDPSQIQLDNPRDMSYGPNSAQTEPNMYMNDSRQPSVAGRETRASSRSTPVPPGRSRRRTPGPTDPVKVPCVNCYRHWWEHDCDEGDPCSNCAAEGIQCVRQKCFNFATGTCDKSDKCPNIHEGDVRYQDDSHLVDQAKAGKRPQRLGKKADAAPAPAAITRQQD